ncbi:DUF1093 domain-containing protein [Lysinibacillus xylanilyticus]|uniref:DUF1093 domain-containing protein n=1 Tax=Lysinibacillus xylanilyticus TaxID=582475 RepID=UPI003CFD3A46
MKIMKFLAITFLLTTFLVGCSNKGALIEKDYYVQINEELQTPNSNGHYVYAQVGYDKDGNKKVVSFLKCTLCKGHLKKVRQLEAAVCILQAAAFLNSIALDNDCSKSYNS